MRAIYKTLYQNNNKKRTIKIYNELTQTQKNCITSYERISLEDIQSFCACADLYHISI